MATSPSIRTCARSKCSGLFPNEARFVDCVGEEHEVGAVEADRDLLRSDDVAAHRLLHLDGVLGQRDPTRPRAPHLDRRLRRELFAQPCQPKLSVLRLAGPAEGTIWQTATPRASGAQVQLQVLACGS